MKEAHFLGSALADWRSMPGEVQDALGYALHLLEAGEIPLNAKPFNPDNSQHLQ